MLGIRFDRGDVHKYWWISEYSKLKIKVPSNQEQQRIASFLSNIDKKIKLMEEIQQLNLKYKKGLLQQMFVSNSVGGALNSPSLRFKGFEEDWKSVKLEEVFETTSERCGESKNYELLTLSAKEGVLFQKDTNRKDTSSKDKKKYWVVKPNQMICNSMVMWKGTLGVSKFTGLTSPDYYVLKISNEKENNMLFFENYFKLDWVINIFDIEAQGLGTKRRLKFPKLSQILLPLPSIKEQNRIASFLSNIDKKIKLMEQIQNLRKQYKKGLLQGLFVGGGVLNVPSLRFKGFDKDWKTVKIADLFTFFKGKGVSKKDIANDGKNKVVLYGEINTTYNWKVNSVESKTNLNKENLVLSVGNQLLFPSSGYVPTTMVCPVSLNESGVIISGDTNILTPLKGYSDFLALVFQANKQELSKILQGTTVRHLYNKDLSFGSIVITEELKEQERIISFLSNTEKQLINCDLRLEFLRSWKVGLLQRMFV